MPAFCSYFGFLFKIILWSPFRIASFSVRFKLQRLSPHLQNSASLSIFHFSVGASLLPLVFQTAFDCAVALFYLFLNDCMCS